MPPNIGRLETAAAPRADGVWCDREGYRTAKPIEQAGRKKDTPA
jgi:hypothetical protein